MHIHLWSSESLARKYPYTSGALAELAHALLDGLARQSKLQIDALEELCLAPWLEARMVAETAGGAPLAQRWLSCAAPRQAKLIELGVRAGEQAVQTQRQVSEVLLRQAHELARRMEEMAVGEVGSEAQPGTVPRGKATPAQAA